MVFYSLGFFPLCPAPSIDDTAGEKRADCLTPPKGGGVSACSGRIVDAQGSAKRRGTRAFCFGYFYFTQNKSNTLFKIETRKS